MNRHPNVTLVGHVAQQLFTGSIDQVKDLLGPGFVWHYFNPRLPDLQGDYAGVQGVKSFLRRLTELTKDSFRVEPVSAQAFGDELVATHGRIHLDMQDQHIDTDAVVVWRVVYDKVVEVWDIPAVHMAPASAQTRG